MGREGHGFNASLYRGKKKVAFVMDSADGGMLDIDWLVDCSPKTDATEADWAKYKAERNEEINLLKTHIATLPSVELHGQTLTVDIDWFIVELVETTKINAKLKRQCKTKTLFRTTSNKIEEHFVIAAKLDEKLRNHLQSKYGKELVEIINDRF